MVDGCGLCVLGCEVGFFIGGMLFDYVKFDMWIYKEEIFGLVFGCVCVKDFGEVVDLINVYEFGNGVLCFMSDGGIVCEFVWCI